MSGPISKKPYLPKSVLDMKFMRKTKERIEKELENIQDHDSLYSKIITNEMRHASGNFISESSFLFCEELMDGRLSYKGMNPDIERLMELENKHEEPSGEMKKDISDETFVSKMQDFKNRKRFNNSPSDYTVKKKIKNNLLEMD